MSTPARPPSSSQDLSLSARIVKDSRNRDTVSVIAQLGAIEAEGDVPAGASKGQDEARTVPTAQAIDNIHHKILPWLKAAQIDLLSAADIMKFERDLINRAGDNFAALGANATLPVSRALWLLGAKLNDMPLYQFLRLAKPDIARTRRVKFLMNVFNGGLHALKDKEGEVLGRDRIAFQEIMIVPMKAHRYAQALKMGDAIDQALKDILYTTYGQHAVSRADEAGFSVKGVGDEHVAIAHVLRAIENANLIVGIDVKLALDVAASSFFDAQAQVYTFAGEHLTGAQMAQKLDALARRYQKVLFSIEDGLAENDWAGWRQHTKSLRERHIVSVGDDLFVTQKPRLSRGIQEGCASAILIKVNQNGTVTGTLDVIEMAYAHGLECIVSHRSGETLNDSISDLAAAIGALGLKSGDPQPEQDFTDTTQWVRRRKYLRMLEIEG